MDLAGELQAVEPRTCTSPWPDYEHVLGYTVLVLPFSTHSPIPTRGKNHDSGENALASDGRAVAVVWGTREL